MSSSKEVFNLRKNGDLDEAYELALQLNDTSSPDDWDKRALGWCLIDLIKRDPFHIPLKKLNEYKDKLARIHLDEKDEIFEKQRDYALSLCDPRA